MSKLPEYSREDDTFWNVRRRHCLVTNLTFGPSSDWDSLAIQNAVSILDDAITSMLNEVQQLRAELAAAQKRIVVLEGNNTSISKWLSAALEDSKVCKEMKEDINNWFSAFEPKKEEWLK